MARNMGASVNQRLRVMARESGVDFSTVQVRYALERLLWRLTQTQWADRLTLKGSLIFVPAFGDVHRPTSDMDVDGAGTGGLPDLLQMIQDAASVPCDDGIEFLSATLLTNKERDYGAVQGGKVSLDARIDSSVVRVRVDAGFGNVVSPAPKLTTYPVMLAGMPQPRVRVYPFECMIAEKLHAAARHGAETTRMRDYYDLWAVSGRCDFDGAILVHALRQTFEQMGDAIPQVFDAFSDDFVQQAEGQWNRFRRGKGLRFQAPPLAEVVQELHRFLDPIIAAARPGGGDMPGHWSAAAGWQDAPGPRP